MPKPNPNYYVDLAITSIVAVFSVATAENNFAIITR